VTASSKLALSLAVLAAALTGALARPLAAEAASPCWKALLTDWYDGRIDDTYPLHCYDDALHHLPPDVQTYSSARDDIMRALQSAKTQLKQNGTRIGPNTEIPPAKRPETKTGAATQTTAPPTTSLPGRKVQGGLTKVADQLNPSSPSSVPVPLLVLGGLALLLVAAGGAGLLLKRHQGRR
jgi:Alphavirus glycoprotein J